jgi:hypothetical protein
MVHYTKPFIKSFYIHFNFNSYLNLNDVDDLSNNKIKEGGSPAPGFVHNVLPIEICICINCISTSCLYLLIPDCLGLIDLTYCPDLLGGQDC